MKKLHITLVGGQSMPVFLGILSSSAQHVALVYSTQTYKNANHIKENIPTKKVELHDMEPISYVKILSQVRKLLDSYHEQYDVIEVNVSSGTKPWSLAFSNLSTNYSNVEIIYINQNCEGYSITKNREWECLSNLSMEQLLRFNGKSMPKSYTPYSALTKEDFKVCEEVEKMRRVNYDDFNTLTLKGDNRNLKKPLEPGSHISYNEEEGWVELTLVNKKNGEIRTKLFKSCHVFDIVFNAGWFEVKIARLLHDWQPKNELWLNVKFPYRDGKDKNEIDVIVNTGNKMLFVECKTQINDFTHIDKFRTATRNYGGMGCKSLFVTDAPMKEGAEEKCADSDIMCFSMQQTGFYDSADKNLYFGLNNLMTNTNI